MNKTISNIVRFVVGVLFIFSGLIKANDPLGLSYKMQEFFELWGWHWLNDYTLALSVLMIGFEIIAGVAVLIGWKFELFSWLLLLLIIFFTFLTGYALFSGKIRECGCFGDCIKLTAGQSFGKDLALLLLILLLFLYRKKIQTFIPPSVASVVMLLTLLFSFGFQWYVLRHLSVVDCLPYKAGNDILKKMKIPPGAIPDSTVINFVYQKDGKEIEFDAEHFPADFNDSLYQFVKRYDKVVRQGNAMPEIKDFILQNAEGVDVTHSFLENPSKKLILIIRNVPDDVEKYLGQLKTLQNLSEKLSAEMKLVSSVPDEVRQRLLPKWPGEKPEIFSCDAVAVKTASRSAMTLYYIGQSTIKNKWAYHDLNKAISFFDKQP